MKSNSCCDVHGCCAPAVWYRVHWLDRGIGLCICDLHRERLRRRDPLDATYYAPVPERVSLTPLTLRLVEFEPRARQMEPLLKVAA